MVIKQSVSTVCRVHIVAEEKRCFSLTENEVVIVLDESIFIAQHCPNSELAKRVTLASGTYHVQWSARCMIETKDFSITAALMPVGHHTVQGWKIPRGAT